MNNRYLKIAALASLFWCGTSNASLISVASGAAYYDTSTALSWAADANLARTSGYDADGRMTWAQSLAWITSLNAQNGGLGYLGVNNWRLPTVTDTGTSGCNFAYTGTDCGYNVDVTTGEMARMFYGTLGNTGYYDTSGTPTGCSGSPPYCLTNSGPFANLQPYYYWSGTQYSLSATNAWHFYFVNGYQSSDLKTFEFNAWAVSPGMVPIPGAAWLFGSALGLLGFVKRGQRIG